MYLNDGFPLSCCLYFWGEYEPSSLARVVNNKHPKAVHTDLTPAKELKKPKDRQNTDPYVYGCFRNICCQRKDNFDYIHGDMLIFGTYVSTSEFDFDTVIVVDKMVPCADVPHEDQYYLACIEPISSIKDNFADGIIYNPETRYYSFVPCIPQSKINSSMGMIDYNATCILKKPRLNLKAIFGRLAQINPLNRKVFTPEPLDNQNLPYYWSEILNAVEKANLSQGIYVNKIDNEKIF